MWRNQNALWAYDLCWGVHIHRQVLIFFFCLDRSLVPWPINNHHLLSWQLALHFCPSLPARSPERPGLRHLGDKLPISPVEHLWGWALLQSSSSTWGKKDKANCKKRRAEWKWLFDYKHFWITKSVYYKYCWIAWYWCSTSNHTAGLAS